MPKPALSPAGPAGLRRQLQDVRDELAERLERIRRDALHRAAPLSADFSDQAQETENDEVLVNLAASTAALLRQYEHALERFDAGLYALCEVCAGPIGHERLEAVPAATRCAGCSAGRPVAGPKRRIARRS